MKPINLVWWLYGLCLSDAEETSTKKFIYDLLSDLTVEHLEEITDEYALNICYAINGYCETCNHTDDVSRLVRNHLKLVFKDTAGLEKTTEKQTESKPQTHPIYPWQKLPDVCPSPSMKNPFDWTSQIAIC